MMGRARPELRSDLRSFPFGAYPILYRAIDDGVEIVRVVHGARNLRGPSSEASRGLRRDDGLNGCMRQTNLTAGARLLADDPDE
jgi:hypothetical protein